jgi:hypothetical protein
MLNQDGPAQVRLHLDTNCIFSLQRNLLPLLENPVVLVGCKRWSAVVVSDDAAIYGFIF